MAKDGVIKLVPVPRIVPPVDVLYQFKVPDVALAPKVKGPDPHLLCVIVPFILGTLLIVAVTEVPPLSHPATLHFA